MMSEDIFPCCICDQREVCSGDLCHTEAEETRSYLKRDTGKWVVVQPDGLLCYYDSEEERIILKDRTWKEIVDYRHRTCGIPLKEIETDTDSQLLFRPFRWEDVKQ